MHHPHGLDALTAICIATLAEGAAIVLFLAMFAVWAGIASGRI